MHHEREREREFDLTNAGPARVLDLGIRRPTLQNHLSAACRSVSRYVQTDIHGVTFYGVIFRTKPDQSVRS